MPDAPLVPDGVPARSSARVARTILIVDDYPPVLAWAARAFQRGGWTVLTAADPATALAVWDETAARGVVIDLLLTELDLPGVGAAALADALRLRQPELPIIALTGTASGVTSCAALLDRATCIRKPVLGTTLLAAADALTGPAREMDATQSAD